MQRNGRGDHGCTRIYGLRPMNGLNPSPDGQGGFKVMPPKVSRKIIPGSLKLFIVLCIFWFLKFSGLLNSLFQKL
jgi:hypothetical protein